jgi:hypothetical protein
MVSLRIDRDVLDFFQGDGPGWQHRINAAPRSGGEVAVTRSWRAGVGCALHGVCVAPFRRPPPPIRTFKTLPEGAPRRSRRVHYR